MTSTTTKVALILPALVALTACVPSPVDLETEPVQVPTQKGVVTCQLYTKNRVLWDRAIDFPATKMSVAEADNVCREEGLRQLNK